MISIKNRGCQKNVEYKNARKCEIDKKMKEEGKEQNFNQL